MSQLEDFDNSSDHVPTKDDEHDNNNMEAPSGNDHDPSQCSTTKKRCNPLTQAQTHGLEEFFKNCSHPNHRERKELGDKLSIAPLRVKYWFQNKRTQTKTHTKQYEISEQRSENERLKAENMHYKAVAQNTTCSSCRVPINILEMLSEAQQLRMENARLHEQIDKMSAIDATPIVSGPSTSSLDLLADRFRRLTEAEKPILMEMAAKAMEEFVIKAQMHEPLWVTISDNPYHDHETFREEEYQWMFSRGIVPKPVGFKCEASRDSQHIFMNCTNLVEILMDENQWLNVFRGIVSKASTLEVLSTGEADSFNGRMQVMVAEYQIASPLVPTRENLFVRYSKKYGDGMWVVVDVSFDHLHSSWTSRCRRKPSGCIIQDMHIGYSKVTWVEHIEVDNEGVHDMFKGLINSGLAFGAKRWMAALDRKCDKLATARATIDVEGCVQAINTLEGGMSVLKLAERMVSNFCNGAGASTAHQWTTIIGEGETDSVRLMSLKSSTDDLGRPSGIVLNASVSVWLPAEPMRIFSYLLDLNSRSEWDLISNGGLVQQIFHITYGCNAYNRVSLMRVTDENHSKGNIFILQDSSSDTTGLYLVYAPVSMEQMNAVLIGGRDPDHVPLLPLGFAIHPNGRGPYEDGIPKVGTGGSLLTVAFQILAEPEPTSKLSLGSVARVESLLLSTVGKIKAATSFPEPLLI